MSCLRVCDISVPWTSLVLLPAPPTLTASLSHSGYAGCPEGLPPELSIPKPRIPQLRADNCLCLWVKNSHFGLPSAPNQTDPPWTLGWWNTYLVLSLFPSEGESNRGYFGSCSPYHSQTFYPSEFSVFFI